MKIKLFEIRDEMTCIPAMAICYNPNMVYTDADLPNWDARIKGIMGRVAYRGPHQFVFVIKLNTLECQDDPHKWGGGRTMREAHQYIEDHFHMLEDGVVVDVRFIVGELNVAVKPECY